MQSKPMRAALADLDSLAVSLSSHAASDMPADADVFRVADGFPSELDKARLKALGNAVVPAVAEFIGRGIVSAERERERGLNLCTVKQKK